MEAQVFQTNPRLRSLLLILIFTFAGSGVALAVLAQIQDYSQEQVYIATQAALPVHKDVYGVSNGENNEGCLDVIAPAKNPENGEVWFFSSPCDVPTDWEIDYTIPFEEGTEVWKTYRNEEYGFEFKYPAEWSDVQETTLTKQETVDFNILKENNVSFDKIVPKYTSISFSVPFSISVIPYSNDSYITFFVAEGNYGFGNIIELKRSIDNNSNIYIGGEKGEVSDVVLGPGAGEEAVSRGYTLITNDKKISLHYTIGPSELDISYEDFNRNLFSNSKLFLDDYLRDHPELTKVKQNLKILNSLVSTFKLSGYKF